MPKPSGDPRKAAEQTSQYDVPAGNYEVTKSTYVVVENFEKKPLLTHVMSLAPLNDAGEQVRGADERRFELSFGPKAIDIFQPAKGKSPDDADPVGQGTDIDAEGNTMYCENETDKFNRSAAAMVFRDSLIHAGFPVSKLEANWAPYFVGLKFTLDKLLNTEINQKMGLKLNTKPFERKDAQGNITLDPAKSKVATKILSLPNGTKAKASKAAEADEDASSESEEETESSPSDQLFEAMQALHSEKFSAGGTVKNFAAFQAHMGMQIQKLKLPKAVMDLSKKSKGGCFDAEWVKEHIEMLGGTLKGTVITFPALEGSED